MVAAVAILGSLMTAGSLGQSPGAPSNGASASLPAAVGPEFGRIVFVREKVVVVDPELALSCGAGVANVSSIWISKDDGSEEAALTPDPLTSTGSPEISPDGARVAYSHRRLGARAARARGHSRFWRFRTASAGGRNGVVTGELATLVARRDARSPSSGPTDPRSECVGHRGGCQQASSSRRSGDRSGPPAGTDLVTLQMRRACRIPARPPDRARSQRSRCGTWTGYRTDDSSSLIRDGVLDSSDTEIAEPTFRLQTINPDGSDVTALGPKLKANEAFDAFEVSPDGRRIVFASGQDGALLEPDSNVDIHVMDLDGSDRVQVTSDPGIDLQPTWSPDGTRLLFSSNRGGSGNLYVMDDDGGNVAQVTRGSGRTQFCDPSWARSAVPIAAAAPSPRGDATDPRRLELGELPAGTYTSSPFAPPFLFTLPSGWDGWHASVDALSLARSGLPEDRLHIHVSRVQVVSEDSCFGSPTKTIGTTTVDFIDWLESHPDLDVSGVRPSDLGGVPGIDAWVSVKQVPGDRCGHLGAYAMLFPVSYDAGFGLKLGDVASVHALDVQGTRVVVIVSGPEATMDSLGRERHGILQSIQFP